MIHIYRLANWVCAALVILKLSCVSPAMATQTVTNTNDSGAGSLREAIATATPGDTVVFDVTGAIILIGGEVVIDKNLTISGPGAGSLAISGNRIARVFRITGTSTVVTISGLKVQDGVSSGSYPAYLYGGGILIEGGTLAVRDSTVSGNSAQQGGGGIANFGTLTVTNSTVSGNSAQQGGGGLYNNPGASMTLNNSTVSGNSAARGGGIFNYGYRYGATLTVNHTIVSGNSGGDGGGISNDWGGTLTVRSSTISGNSAPSGDGGGIKNYSGPVTVTHSTVSGNSARGSGGGIANQNGPLTVTNSTLSGNSAQSYGGGIYSWLFSLTITHSTLAGNSAAQGGGILGYGIVRLKNSLLANAPSGGNCSVYSSEHGWPTSHGHNLSSDGTCAYWFTQSGDLNNTNPQLDPDGLKDNGGPTKTVALLVGSPTIDAIPVGDCTDGDGNSVATDQRGVTRPQGSACDIGAFELVHNQAPVANAGPDQTAACSSPAGTPVTLSGSGSDQDGDTLSFLWKNAAGNVVGNTATVNLTLPLGTHTFTLTVDDGKGGTASDTVTVTVRDTTPPALTLARTSMTVVLPTATATGATASLSGIASATDTCCATVAVTNNAPALFPIGGTQVTFTATDASGNYSQKQMTVQVAYNFLGFLPPVPSDGSGVFNAGRTIPLKFQLAATDGSLVTTATATLQVFKATGQAIPPEASGASNTGNLFRFDPASKQYIYDLSTVGYAAGTYLLRVTLNDQTTHAVQVSLR
jgi:hypothetical protein